MDVRNLVGAALIAMAGGAAAQALGAEAVLDGGNVVLSGSLGVTALSGEEIVYYDAGSPIVVSRLFWQSLAPVLTTGLDVKLPGGWTLKGGAQMAVGGLSYMEDYDWIDPASYAFDDWSDRSQHPDTNLDWYFNGSMFVGHDFAAGDHATVNVNAEVKYVDVQWTAYGGSYVYSSGPGSPRDLVGDFTPGERGITLRQMLPAALAGIDAEIAEGAWTLALSAHGGMTFNAADIDYHWQRTDIGPGGGRFEDFFRPSPYVTLAGTATYALSDSLDLFVTGTYEEMLLGRGDTKLYDQQSDTLLATYLDGEGGAFRAASVSAGLKGTF